MGVSTDEIFAQQATRLFERFRNSFQATITVIPSSIEVIFAEVNDFFFQGADFRGIRFDRFRFVDGCCIFFFAAIMGLELFKNSLVSAFSGDIVPSSGWETLLRIM